jgi:hypothetical protein
MADPEAVPAVCPVRGIEPGDSGDGFEEFTM